MVNKNVTSVILLDKHEDMREHKSTPRSIERDKKKAFLF